MSANPSEQEGFIQSLKETTFPSIVGQSKVKEQVKSALLSGRHIILVGPPGVGKTTLAKSVAELLPSMELSNDSFRRLPDGTVETKEFSGSERFVRVQGSPDLTAEDLMGDIDPIKAMEYGPLSMEAFSPGKIFKANTGVLFFDEVNRCSHKLQNALLQVLQEGIATVGSYDIDLPAQFIFIGTMNPDDNSTEELSAVFLDRFDIIYVSYPETLEEEKSIVRGQAKIHAEFRDDLFEFVVRFVRDIRHDKNLEQKPSVRATIGLIERASAHAHLAGREQVSLQDITVSVPSVLAHRISLKPAVRYLKSTQEYVEDQYNEFVKDVQHQLGGEG